MDDAMEYSGWAIVDFKREAVQAGVTPRSTAGEIGESMMGGVGMLYVNAPATPGHEGQEDWWAPTLIAHIQRANEATVMAYLAKQRSRSPAPRAEAAS